VSEMIPWGAPGDPEHSASAGARTYDLSRYRARRIRARLLALLDVLALEIERRDLRAAWAVLEDSDACRCFPPAVREEALTIAQLPPTAFRAPLRLYRYRYVLAQLGDEPLEVAMVPAELPLDAGLSGPASESPPVRVLQFPGTRSPDHDPHRGGSDRRRSGSR